MRNRLSLIVCLVLLQSGVAIAQPDRYSPAGIGKSMLTTRNINHPDGVKLQDLKRSVGWVVFPANGSISNCSCNLLNTVGQDKTPYISLAAHCLSKSNYEVGGSYKALFSFDFEMPHTIDRGDPTTDRPISGVYIAGFTVLLRDDLTDLALIKLEGDFKPDLIKYAYAAGWDNRMADGGNIWSNINHPMEDHKKVLIDPGGVDFKYARYLRLMGGILTRYGYFYETKNLWNGQEVGTEDGSSGSGLFSKNQLLKAISSASSDNSSAFGSISNSWYGLSSQAHFSKHLDAGNQWLNYVPGGYRNDLLPTSDASFDLVLQPRVDISTPGVLASNPTTLPDDVLWVKPSLVFDAYGWQNDDPYNPFLLGHKIGGIKAERPIDENLVLSLNYLDKDENTGRYTERLIYGTMLKWDTPVNQPLEWGFKGEAWDCDNLPPGCPPCNRRPITSLSGFFGISASEGMSTEIKQAYLEAVKDQGAWTSLSQTRVPITVSLKNNGSTPLKVKAIAYPGEVPLNALQLFKPLEVAARFKSNKYPASYGQNSGQLFINQLTLNQGDPINDKTISTGDNGGYLNLVNSLQTFGPIELSSAKEKKELKITVDVANTSGQSYNAKVWMDYFPEVDSRGYYNFVADEVAHEIELLQETTLPLTTAFSFTVPMPEYLSINMRAGESRYVRMRVAVSKTNTITQDGIYVLGEVEDYLVELVAPVEEEPQAANCPVDDAEDVCSAQGTSINQNVGGVINDGSHRRLGASSLHFPGTEDYLALDVHNQFMQNAFGERTVSFWLYHDQGSGVHDLYDEGGSGDGLGIRLNEGKLELGVQANGSLSVLSSVVALPLSTWVHVVGVFNNGKLQLYINGHLEVERSQVGFTTVPAHNDGSGFGATHGTNVFALANNGFNGWLDELKIYEKALNEGEVAYVYNQANGLSANAPDVSYGPGTDPGLEAAGATAAARLHTTKDLLLYPNPTSGAFTVLLEGRQAGQATLRVRDLSGRQVHEKQVSVPERGYYSIPVAELKLPPGTYVVEVVNGSMKQVGTLVVR